jgi:hypothetical protein
VRRLRGRSRRARNRRYGASACSCPQQQTMRNFKLASGHFWRACSNRVGPSAKTCRIDSRWATTNAVEIRRHAAELAALAPDAILASSSPALAALQQATRTVPIVFVNVIDPCSASKSRRRCSPAPTRSSNKLARLHQLCCTCLRPLLALFCRANRAEQCPLSGVDRPTYAQREFFAF